MLGRDCTVYLNSEVCKGREIMNSNSTGKISAFMLLIFDLWLLLFL